MIVKRVLIDEALKVHAQIPEFVETLPDPQYFKNRYAGKDALILAAYSNNEAVGYLIGYSIDPTNFYCWMAGVIPNARKHGALTLLIDEMFGYAGANNYQKISIKTRNKHRSMLMFLVKNGFNLVSVEKQVDILENRINFEKSRNEV